MFQSAAIAITTFRLSSFGVLHVSAVLRAYILVHKKVPEQNVLIKQKPSSSGYRNSHTLETQDSNYKTFTMPLRSMYKRS